jgi:hypothetical protein
MQEITETQRHPSPGGRPQPLAFYGGRLWVGAWDTGKLYAIDTQKWSVTEDVTPPGRPFGIAAFEGGLSVVVALEDDNRYLFRFKPGSGFDAKSKRACPDFTGSHLAADGTNLYLCQQGKRRILMLDADANVQREIALPTRCAGLAFRAPGSCFIISADEEFEKLGLAHLDVRQDAPADEPVATFPFDGARGLTFDGTTWWTSEREASEIVAFTAG